MTNESLFVKYALFWYNERRLNVIPYDTKNRKPTLSDYRQYQNSRIPEIVFKEWTEKGQFEKGMAIFPGKVYLENNKDELYWVSFDFDTKEAIEEFCHIFGKNVTLAELSKRFVVEQHKDNLEKAHVSMLSPIPFPNKGADSKIGLEVKSKGEHGIMFVSPSPHKHGGFYEIIGSKEPCILNKDQAYELILRIDNICKKHGLEYLERKTGVANNQLKRTIKNLKIDDKTNIQINEGERNSTLLSIACSLLFNHYEKDDADNGIQLNELKGFFEKINEKYCSPVPLPQEEVDSVWRNALTYVEKNKDFTLSKRGNGTPYDKKPNGIIEEATEKIRENNHFITLEESKEILYYHNGVYKPGGEIIIEKETEALFGYDLANNHIIEIRGHIMRKTYHKREELDADVNTVNLQNGLYDVIKNELKPHTPSYLSVNQKPIVYNPKAKSKLFGGFLKDVLFPTDIRTAIEAMAYTFYRNTPFEYFFKLFGYGSNGKSVFTGLLTSLHSERNVSNVSLSSLVGNRFALADLENKDVNIDIELSNVSIQDTSILKKLTGGRKQPIRIERKNQKAYDTYLHAKLFFNTNTITETIDQTAAYYRREIIISFPNTFEGKSDDPNLQDKITSENEISGIFNVLMIALRTLLKNNGVYLNEKTIEDRRIKSERASDPVKSFIEEAVNEESIESDWVVKSDFYDVYCRYCKRHTIAIKSIEAFGKDLKNKGYTDGRKGKKHERRTCWLGVKLDPDYVLEEGKEKQQKLLFENNVS